MLLQYQQNDKITDQLEDSNERYHWGQTYCNLQFSLCFQLERC